MPEEAYAQLRKLQEDRQYTDWQYFTAAMFTASAFSILFGGRFPDLLPGMLCGAGVFLIKKLFAKRQIAPFITDMVCSGGIALTALLAHTAFPDLVHTEPVIIGGLMLLVPGVAITGAARDILVGDYVSGSARVLEACVCAFSVALGTGVVFFLKGVF